MEIFEDTDRLSDNLLKKRHPYHCYLFGRKTFNYPLYLDFKYTVSPDTSDKTSKEITVEISYLE